MYSKRSKLFTFLAALMALSMILSACQPAAEEPVEEPTEVEEVEPTEAMEEEEEEEDAEPTEAMEEEEKVLKVGVLGPYTGGSARTGEEFKAAAQMAFSNIDYTIGDYTIELVWVDSECDPAVATQAYEQAIVDDEVDTFIINWCSSVSVACMDLAAKYEVPHFSAFGATNEVNRKWNSDTDKYYYWVNKWWPAPASLAPAYVDTIETAIENGNWSPEEKTAVIWGEDTDWGRSFAEGMINNLEAEGWEILSEEYFPQDQTEFVPTLNKVKNLDPALFAGTTVSVPFVSALINQADQVGLNSVMIADGLSWVGDWYSNVGDSSDYILDAVQSVSLASEEGQQFISTFEEDYDMTPSPSSGGLAYDAANFFIKAAQMTYEEYGELSSETLAEFAKNEIQTGNWSYTDGIVMEEYLFTPESSPDPVVGQGFYSFPIVQYFGGEGVKIYPENVAEQEFTPPPAE